MVTIYDMVTGELIHSDTGTEAAPLPSQAAQHPALLAPRLQTVEEAKASEAKHPGMPMDLAQRNIDAFIADQ